MKGFLVKSVLGSSAAGFSVLGSYCYTVSRRPSSEKLHVVMDLDGTIFQTYPIKFGLSGEELPTNANHSGIKEYDNKVIFEAIDGEKRSGYYVWYRPFANSTMWLLNKLFNVHVFTAATQRYAESCASIFPFNGLRLYRESVTEKDSHGKDLTLITSEKAVLVDDQLRNRTGDQEFYHIQPYIRFINLDFELPKFCLWAIRWNMQHDIQTCLKQINKV